jgi:hypothetical protein
VSQRRLDRVNCKFIPMNKNEMHGDASTIDADAKKLMSPCPIFFSDPLEDKILYSEFFFKTGHRVLHANFSTPC